MRIPAAFFLATLIACAADRCSPSPELARFINALPADYRAKLDAIEERIKQAPNEFDFHRIFLDSSVYEKKPIRERYLDLLQSHPDNLDYQFLQARSLVGSETRQALEIYSHILYKDPDYPWVHLSQLAIYRSPAFRDRAKLAASFATLQRVCPASFEPYSYLNEIPDNGIAAVAAPKLRELLKDAKTPADLRLYSTLWAVEFRVRPEAEHDDERTRITEDLKQLLPFDTEPRIQAVIANGAKLTGDTALEQRMTRERQPDPSRAVSTQINAWFQKHPRPKTGASADARHAYGKELLAKSDEWRKLLSDRPSPVFNRVEALVFLDAAPEEIGRAGDELLALTRRSDPLVYSWIISMARNYLEAGVLLDRIEPLCTEAINRMDDPEGVIEIDLAPDHAMTARNRQGLVNQQVDALIVLAGLYEKQGNREKAHAKLWEASDFLEAKAPTAAQTDPMVLDSQSIGRFYLLLARAEMAEREGRKLDALNGYRDALAARNMLRIDLTARQRKLWKELGGSDEGWLQWTASLTSESPDLKTSTARSSEGGAENRKLPPLTAKDIDGNGWTLDRFAGKTVVAVVWATWCEPCRAELPYFAKLVDRLKDRPDVLAVSFNTDDNVAVAQSFLKSMRFTFPVLSVKQYAEDLMPIMAIPRTWIIRDGIIAKEHQGFGRDGDKWVDQILAELR